MLYIKQIKRKLITKYTKKKKPKRNEKRQILNADETRLSLKFDGILSSLDDVTV